MKLNQNLNTRETSLLSLVHQSFIQTNNQLKSENINNQEILTSIQEKYNISEFEVYKYIRAYDFLTRYTGVSNYTLAEGILSPKNRYKNILIDLLYHNISGVLINLYPLSIVFGIKRSGREITDLTRSDINK